MSYHISINKDRCKGCSLCVNFCPVKILQLGESSNLMGYRNVVCLDEGKCIGCQSCVRMCPDCVIGITKDE
jgi:2-oxoglutarate ferredoxin oxidoreductase subunit delta